MNFTKTTDRARGRWREILPALGVPSSVLVNKHGPCPICGGKTRFRFDDKEGDGTWICSRCGAGTGIILLRKLHGWDFKTACGEVDGIIGTDAAPTQKQSRPSADVTALASVRLKRVEQIIESGNDYAVVERYLARRGLKIRPAALLGAKGCPYFDDVSKRLVGHFPTVLAPIVDRDDSIQSVQRIYDADIEPRKKMMPAVSTVNGAACRLFELNGDTLGVGEGCETSCAVAEMFSLPVWATVTANGMKTFVWPKQVKRLVIFGDNDSSFTGQAAAYELARRAASAGLEVEVRIPDQVDTDWLDVLNARKVAAE